MRDLDVSVVLFNVLKPLQMERQDHRQFFDAHSLLRLLVGRTIVALELVVAAQSLGAAVTAQAVRDRSVLLNVHLQIDEVLVLAAHVLAVQTTCLARQNALIHNIKHIFVNT